ncbi:HypC/HybG/HupF family hydrogenase formation chaperone [Corynebacterium diphtheriae]|nr:HypC/HybG/HupF family hydrogenase formation chaperone [Corynebacterium diphtheriae]
MCLGIPARVVEVLDGPLLMEVLDEKSAQESLATIAEFNLVQQVQLAPREPR